MVEPYKYTPLPAMADTNDDSHAIEVLKHMHCKLLRGDHQGTDLTLQVGDNKGVTKNFFLHHCVAAPSSSVLARCESQGLYTFSSFLAEDFEVCVAYMYRGGGVARGLLTGANAASVGGAARSLGMPDLTKVCVEFLDRGLCHENHREVLEVAGDLDASDLLRAAARFSSPNGARDEIARRKADLSERMAKVSADVSRLEAERRAMKRELDQLESRWKAALEADLARATEATEAAAAKESRSSSKPDAQNDAAAADLGPTHSYPSKDHRENGGIGRVVVCPQYYEGTTKYGDKDESENWQDYNVAPPPPPTKQMHDEHGIIYCHSTIVEALKEAEAGDRIYLLPGQYDFDMHETLRIAKSLEIIGLGSSKEETILWRSNASIRICGKANVRITNVVIKCGQDVSRMRYVTEDDERTPDPMCIVDSDGARLFLDGCTFDMGTEAEAAKARGRVKKINLCEGAICGFHTGAVSGIHIHEGRFVTIEHCQFIGGCGSAIAITNDRYFDDFDTPPVEVLQCTFTNTGQPKGEGPPVGTGGWSRKDEAVPGPAVVELWNVQRKGKLQKPHEDGPRTIRLAGNSFTNNFRAPFTYRILQNKNSRSYSEDLPTEVTSLRAEASKTDGHNMLHIRVHDYDVCFTHNTIKSNGLGFGKEVVQRALSSLDCENVPPAKKCKITRGGKGKSSFNVDTFPDGEVVLVVKTDVYREFACRGECIFWPYIGYDE